MTDREIIDFLKENDVYELVSVYGYLISKEQLIKIIKEIDFAMNQQLNIQDYLCIKADVVGNLEEKEND